MKQLFFWLMAIIALFSFSQPFGGNFLTEIALDQFENWMESEQIREIFDLEEEEAVAVFGQTTEEIYL